MPEHSLFCLVRAELRKVVRQRSNWALLPAAVALGAVARTAAADQATVMGLDPFQLAIDTYRAFAAAGVGVIMLAVTARLVALEYQLGTIRVVLARGVGRLRLLTAKFMAMSLVAVSVLALLALAGVGYVAVELHGQTAAVSWHDVWLAALVIALSAAACMVIGLAAGAVGRSMTFAMGVAAGFFPFDNGLGIVLPLLQNATQERVWADLTTYLLGPALNHLPSVLMGRHAAELVTPQLPVTTTHCLLVIAGYVVVLAVAAVLVTWRRETLE